MNSFADTQRDVGQVFTPHPYQKDGIFWLLSNENAGLFFPPGLGKTAVVLEAFKWMVDAKAATKMLVVAPIRVAHLVWPVEVKKWEGFSHLKVSVVHGPKKQQALDADVDIYVVNPEGLKWIEKRIVAKIEKSVENWALIVDESSNFKNARSQRFKILKKIDILFKRRIIMTATPAPNGLINLWPQVYILDQGKRLGKYITQFRNKFFYPAGYMGYDFRLKDGGDDEIYAAIDDIIMHKGREEIDMPKLLPNPIEVELPPAAKTAYRDMQRDLIAMCGDEAVTAVTASTMSNKLRQIASGAVYTNTEGDWIEVHDQKLVAVKELSDSLDGRPLMIFYEYRHDLARLQKLFPESRNLGGGVKAAEAEEIVNLWNNSEIPQLLLHPASAGHGLNLQESTCTDLCWFTITWDQELHEQAIGRVWRQGQKNGVTAHYLAAAGTIDYHVLDVLNGKETLQNALLIAMKK